MKKLHFTSALLLILSLLFHSNANAKNLTYRLKIYAPINEIKDSLLQDYLPLRKSEEATEIGHYNNYLIAMKAQYTIEDMGYGSCDIVAYFNFKPISLNDAFELENNLNERDEKSSNLEKPNEDKFNSLINEVTSNEFQYVILLNLKSEDAVNGLFDMQLSSNNHIKSEGTYDYSLGSFKTFREAKSILDAAMESGIIESKIIAYENNMRISLDVALEREKNELDELLLSVNK